MIENKSFVSAIIVAAGSGSRMKSNVTKQRIELLGSSVLLRTVLAFDSCGDIDEIIVVVREDETEFARGELCDNISKPLKITIGGKSRAESVRRGFDLVSEKADFVAIHDGARCLIESEQISSVIAEAEIYGAATAVSSVYDTVKMIDDEGFISETLDRTSVVRAATPQVFAKDIYYRAIQGVTASDAITDDNMLVEALGVKIKCVDVGVKNIKITTMQDIRYAEFLLAGREN